MNDKLTDNNETQEVVAKPIFRIKERQEEVAKTDVIVGQSIDSVANDGNEIDLEIEEKVNVKSQNGTKSVAKEESNDNNAAQENFEKITAEEKALKNAIEEQAREDEQPQSNNFTLKKIIGGDIFSAQLFRNNIWLILIVVLFTIIYISNRYSVQKDLIEIDKLENKLSDTKYRALSSSSQLTEKSRESHVLELLKTKKDSVLKMSSRPPFIINVPTK
ncbi:FtsL-like putative cell division protein [Prevotella disiens]|uniref:FtsL-like putative cell division protein n=1 Tax=Prevotella disiens TaxID=28130 RepID=UPI0028893A4C|nr:FtsL-like putative cell division protein [Prevotella disiens]